MAASYYTVGSSSPLAGKTLNQINQQSYAGQIPGFQGVTFNPGDIAKYLGISADTPLTAGMQLTYNGGQSQGDTDLIGKLFQSETPEQVANANADAANQQIIKENQPIVQAAGSQITNIGTAYQQAQDVYGSAIPTIKAQYGDILNQITKSTNAQYAQRGLTSNSPQMGYDLATAQTPVANQEAGALNTVNQAIANLGIGGTNAINNLLGIIGQANAGAPLQTLSLGMQQAQLPFQQAEMAAQAALGSAQAGVAGYVPIPGLGIYSPATSQLLSPYGNATLGAGGGVNVSNINGVPSLYIP